jgi:hypothetical protein
VLPPKTDHRWEMIVTGKVPVVSTSLSAQMLLTRTITSTAADPSPSNIAKRVDELYAFFQKFPHTVNSALADFLR